MWGSHLVLASIPVGDVATTTAELAGFVRDVLGRKVADVRKSKEHTWRLVLSPPRGCDELVMFRVRREVEDGVVVVQAMFPGNGFRRAHDLPCLTGEQRSSLTRPSWSSPRKKSGVAMWKSEHELPLAADHLHPELEALHEKLLSAWTHTVILSVDDVLYDSASLAGARIEVWDVGPCVERNMDPSQIDYFDLTGYGFDLAEVLIGTT